MDATFSVSGRVLESVSALGMKRPNPVAGRSLTGKKKGVPLHSFPKKSLRALPVFNHGWWLAVGGWWELAVGGWWSRGAVLKGGP